MPQGAIVLGVIVIVAHTYKLGALILYLRGERCHVHCQRIFSWRFWSAASKTPGTLFLCRGGAAEEQRKQAEKLEAAKQPGAGEEDDVELQKVYPESKA
eukprot:scaffold8485_cov277-Pinguiococcus_pyrenoidosus.AAC.6